MNRQSVLVVAAGAGGWLTALSLARAGLDVSVLEGTQEPIPLLDDLVYQWAVLPTLAELGVLDGIREGGVETSHVFLHVPATGEFIDFDHGALASETAYPFNLHVSEEVVVAEIKRVLGSEFGATYLGRADILEIEQDADGVLVSYGSSQGISHVRPAWLVGADGARSVVRRSLGLSFPGVTWQERLVTVELEAPLEVVGFNGSGSIVAPGAGAIAANVVPGERWRYVFAEPRMWPEESLDQRVEARLASAIPLGVLKGVGGWVATRMHERCAPSFRSGRCLLVGDAAHVTNPTTAMGTVAAVFDAAALTRALVLAVEARGAGVDRALDAYSTSRRTAFTDVISPSASERKKLIFDLDNDAAVEREIGAYRRAASTPEGTRAYLREVLNAR